MANNYTVIQTFLDVELYDSFAPTADPLYYACDRKPSVILAKTMLDAYPAYFQQVPEFGATEKISALALKHFDDFDWSPAIGNYFTSEDDIYDLWVIIGDTGSAWQVALLRGGNENTELPTVISYAALVADYCWVDYGTDDSDSGSASGSSSLSSSV